MIYAMSDIHGHYNLFIERIEQIKTELEVEGNKLILLGDYIDRGPDSFKCLELACSLQNEYGNEKVIVLKGNHEEWFLDFINGQGDEWLAEDEKYITSKTFISEEQLENMININSRNERLQYLQETIRKNHEELFHWISKLPPFYETSLQIFVHAGVDEEISEAGIDYCALATPEYILTGKYPPTTGKFYKDIIAGHTAVSSVAKDKDFKGVFFDGASHYFIDGGVERTGYILCLAYDEVGNKYHEIKPNGEIITL